MLKWLILGLAVAGGSKGCGGKHETSAPHTTVTLNVAGLATQEIPHEEFGDGWALHYTRFHLAPTFGVDDIFDNPKKEEPITGPDAYVFGGEDLELTRPGSTPGFYSSTVSGRSSGWGMHLRPVVSAEDGAVPSEPSLEVAGEAIGPDGERVRFTWGFVTELWFAQCLPKGRDALVLPENGVLDLQVELDGRALFRDPHGGLPLRFEPFTAADGDADGEITTAELRALPASEVDLGDESASSGSLYDVLQARLERLVADTYTCHVSADDCQDRPTFFGACDDTDKADKDADGDGVRNCMDSDIDGDGVENGLDCDPYTTLESLAQCDGSDRHEKDSDGDGIRNCEDSDIDGDGIPNEHDGRVYDSPYERSTK